MIPSVDPHLHRVDLLKMPGSRQPKKWRTQPELNLAKNQPRTVEPAGTLPRAVSKGQAPPKRSSQSPEFVAGKAAASGKSSSNSVKGVGVDFGAPVR